MDMSLLTPRNPHFAQIGGAAAIERLVQAFYRRVDTLPEAALIRAMHPEDLTPTKAVLVMYLTEWMGGPRDYSRGNGPPRLRRVHMPFAIGPAERDAWMLCMRGALAEVVADEALRGQLERAFHKIADTIRNDPENPHDRNSGHGVRTP